MNCPKCQSDNTRVTDSRLQDSGRSVRRRRECEKCAFRFTTFEKMRMIEFLVKKRDGTAEVYDRDKLLRGVFISCEKRPVSHPLIEEKIIEKEHAWNNKENMTSVDIGIDVLNILKDIDHVAYIRFASVYYDFDNIETFMNLLQNLQKDLDEI
jgi:transcriptional repressor NrdR